MQEFDLYGDIAHRTGGELYIGVVGPVRTGKSTFISRFMQSMVLPNMEESEKKKMAEDFLPQSGTGKTVTTTEPKFVPTEGAHISFGNGGRAKVRMIDCVGYLVNGALGSEEEGAPRMVKTPWQEQELPFTTAAEMGTRKVIAEHSTVAVLVTTDGTFTDIPRSAYQESEEAVARELQAAGKPFVILLNTQFPEGESARSLQAELAQKYGVPVLVSAVLSAGKEDFTQILQRLLYEFPLTQVEFTLPAWLQALPQDHPVIAELISSVKGVAERVEKMKDYTVFESVLGGDCPLCSPAIREVSPSTGSAVFALSAKEGYFYQVLSETCGEDLTNEFDLLTYCKNLSVAKREYEKLKYALTEVEAEGYGVVVPGVEELTLQPPEIVKRGGGYGVKLKATAPSLHVMKVDVSTEISPIVGTEEQSREMVQYLTERLESDPSAVWETKLFGKTLHSMMAEGMEGKITAMPFDTRKKMQKTVSRIVNEGKGGVLCILL